MKERRLILGLVIIIFAGAVYALGWSSLFTVTAVQITGTDNPPTTSVKIGEKLARIQPRVVGAEFERFKWIERADVSRNWLSGKVTIALTQRRPIAIYEDQAIDAFGIAFTVTNQRTEGLPQIQAGTIDAAVAGAQLFADLPVELGKNVKVLKVRSGDLYILEMEIGGKSLQVIWGQDEDMALKVKVYKALLAQPENTKIRRIDVSAPNAPIVK